MFLLSVAAKGREDNILWNSALDEINQWWLLLSFPFLFSPPFLSTSRHDERVQRENGNLATWQPLSEAWLLHNFREAVSAWMPRTREYPQCSFHFDSGSQAATNFNLLT